ncbi:MAG: UDP-N-acetylglucosamine 1-carboxyvinyltransferase [Bdellovibrionales bacterium GWB1_55_8]|nr:MAG: UDP-N-acetylglucosamine 1-carboxyvinyltransferase [Bdellovibrionales bacterium GWB1_55_8]
MDKIKITGGVPLHGSVQVSGAKNAALPILIASLLVEGKCTFRRVPQLQDIRTTLKLLSQMGAEVSSDLENNQVEITCAQITQFEAPYDLVRTMRASVVVLGPLLARFGHAKVSLPGGCAIGARPINYHLVGLERLGAEIRLEDGYVIASAKKLKGATVAFEFPSVGATENVMMAAVLAEGESVLENCAKEPEIVDLARALRAMGADIEGEGTEQIRIRGKRSLHGCDFEIMGDRIEAGTFLAAAFATGGEVEVRGIGPECLEAVLLKFEESGAKVTRGQNSLHLASPGTPKAVDITTQPYPGFPTDMQAQFMALMAVSTGASIITETIFENRFMHVPELARLGADITIRGNNALIRGKPRLTGAPLMATDLRASASLVIGGLCAEGETTVHRVYHLDRGYEKMETKLRALGARIERLSE